MTESKKSNWFGDEEQKGNFSNDRRDTFDPEKRYIGIRLQQGVPLLDRDWNELEDIRRYEEQMLRKWYIGDGVPEVPDEDGFRIMPPEKQGDDFKINKGKCMVDGFLVINDSDILYSAQTEGEPDAENISELTEFFVYLDLWIEEVNGEADPALKNKNDVNMETCVRHQLKWRVRVRSGDLAPKAHHHYYDLASVERGQTGSIKEEYITDLRRTGLSLHRLRDELSTNKIADSLHRHSKLVASDGSPDPALCVDKSGKVGIGTDAPQSKLDVRGDICLGPPNVGNGGKLLLTYAEYTHYIRAKDYWTEFVSHPGQGWKFISKDKTTESEMVRITSSGKVGIGTADPKDTLEVAGGVSIFSKVLDGHNAGFLKIGRERGTDNYWFITHRSKDDDNLEIYKSEPGTPATSNATATPARWVGPLFTIDRSGNVGIGTGKPTGKLSVTGVSTGQTGIEVLGGAGNSAIPFRDGNIYLTGDISEKATGSGAFVFRAYDGKVHTNRFVIDGKTGNARINHSSLKNAKGGDVIGLSLLSFDEDPSKRGGVICGNDVNHSIFLGVGRDGTTNVNDYHQAGTHRFFTGGMLQDQKERMKIDDKGNVGIGTDAPQAKLDVRGDICLGPPNVGTGGKLLLTHASDFHYIQANNYWTEFVSHPNEGWKFISNDGKTKTVRFKIDSRTGDAVLTGKLTQNADASDARLKTDIVPLTNVLDKLNKVRGISFQWNDLYESLGFTKNEGRREIGLIAQEVEAVFPEIVRSQGEEKYRFIDYGKMTAVLVEAVKELKAEVDALRRKITS